MDGLIAEQEKLEEKANISKCIDDVQSLIDHFNEAGRAAEADPQSAPLSLAKLQQSSKKRFDQVNDDVKQLHHSIRDYGRAEDKRVKDPKPLPLHDCEALPSNQSHVNRAIAMHLIREGHFAVAKTFFKESKAKPRPAPLSPTYKRNYLPGRSASERTAFSPPSNPSSVDLSVRSPDSESWMLCEEATRMDYEGLQAFRGDVLSPLPSEQVHGDFKEMWSILDQMKAYNNLAPAIEWARSHSETLDARGSNLEFDLCRLQYLWYFASGHEPPTAAVTYAQQTFPSFPSKYEKQIQELLTALAYRSNVAESPYASILGDCSVEKAITIASTSFVSEFCATLRLASASPLLSAITAGCIALPTLQKFMQIQAKNRTSWTTDQEMPINIPLPNEFAFHSIFVCPITKEQGTDVNPPMRAPCGHLLARESVQNLEKFRGGPQKKCPYCPTFFLENECQRVLL